MTKTSYWVQITVPRSVAVPDTDAEALINLARATLGDETQLRTVLRCAGDFTAVIESEVDTYDETITLTALLDIEAEDAPKLDKGKLTKLLRGDPLNEWAGLLTVEKRVVPN